MYAESRKIHLIEEVLKVTNEGTLVALETVLKKSKKAKSKKLSIYDFVGILTKKESGDMRKAIKETAEIINPDDWR
jgi:UDP-glucose 6-dehydrogenase